MKILHFYLFCCAISAFVGCVSTSGSKLRLDGKWVNKEINAKQSGVLYVEFFPDGNASIWSQYPADSASALPNPVVLSYKVLDNGQLQFFGPMGFSLTSKFNLRGEKLELTWPDGQTDMLIKE